MDSDWFEQVSIQMARVPVDEDAAEALKTTVVGVVVERRASDIQWIVAKSEGGVGRPLDLRD